MRILVIEDNPLKAAAVRSVIEAELADEDSAELTVVESMSGAVELLARGAYHLIILDLMVPFIPRGMADSSAGVELLRHIRKPDGLSRSAVVIGLSAFPQELGAAKGEFDKSAVLLVEYDLEGKWRHAISRVTQDARLLITDKLKLDFLIFVALGEEAEPYKNSGLDYGSYLTAGGLNAQLVKSSSGFKGAIIRLREMGLVAALIDTVIALPIFEPTVVGMSGICAGFSERTELGQIIVGSPAWEYQAGKWSADDFLIAPNQVQLRPKTRVAIDQILNESDVLRRIETGLEFGGDRPSRIARPVIAPAATGSAVIASTDRLAHIEKQHRKVAALDMETYGLYRAAYESPFLVKHFFSVKSVVDFADKHKSDSLHQYGSSASAKLCLMIIEKLLTEH